MYVNTNRASLLYEVWPVPLVCACGNHRNMPCAPQYMYVNTSRARVFIFTGLALAQACMGGGMAGEKLMINTVVGDHFDAQDTATALACSNIAASIAVPDPCAHRVCR